MKNSLNKYFQKGYEKGFEVYQISNSNSKELSVTVINDDVETQTIGDSSAILGLALLNGKVGRFSTDAIDKNTPQLLADNIAESALYGKEEVKENFFDGKAKYKKAKTCLKEFKPADLHELRSLGLELSKYIRGLDKRITHAEINLSMDCGENHLANSLGLKCKKQTKVFLGSIYVIASDTDGEHRSGSCMFCSFKNLEELKAKSMKEIPTAIANAVDFFKSGPVKGKTYKAVLAPGVVSALLAFFISHLQAKLVQQHLSIFENKLGEKIASRALTIKHTPHITSISASPYDTEGVPTQDFVVIDKGVLKTYFYSLETARYFKTESNGCASGNGNSSPFILTMKPGKYSKEDLFAKIKNGLYINDVSGLNSGIDSTSLNFSLPCQGYVIKDGKKDKAVSMIIMAGNLLDLFNDVSYIGSDVYDDSSIITPSIAVKKLQVSGK